MAQINAQMILEDVSKLMSQQTGPTVKKQILDTFNEKVDLMLVNINAAEERYKILKNTSSTAKALYADAEKSAQTELIDRYVEQRMHMTRKQCLRQIVATTFQGYETIMKFRNHITNSEINYAIGVMTEAEGQSEIGNLILKGQELIDLLVADSASRGQGISLRFNIAATRQKLAEMQASVELANHQAQLANAAVQSRTESTSDRSTIYSQIWHFYMNQPPVAKKHGRSINGQVRNWGNFYEAYRSLVAKHGTNRVTLPWEEIQQALIESGGNTPFSNAGDVGLQQDKLVGMTAASLSTSKAIKIRLEAIKTLMNAAMRGQVQTVTKIIRKHFVDTKAKTQLDKKSANEAARAIEESFAQMNLKLTIQI